MKLTERHRTMSVRALAMMLAPLVVISAALLPISRGSAATAGKPSGGLIHFYEVATLSSSVAHDVLTGAITDHGTDREENGSINKIALSKGSFEISTAKLTSQPPPRVDAKTCAFSSTVTAPVPIVRGSGRGGYQGISGTIRATITEAGIMPRRPSGKCNTSQSAAPVGGVTWAWGFGTISFG